MSPSKFVDIRNITTASSPKYKKGVEELTKMSLEQIKKGKSTINKEIKLLELFKQREKNTGKPIYVKLFTDVQDKLKKNTKTPTKSVKK